MPHVKQVKISDPRVTVAYVVDAAVGRGGVNQRGDVLLVQHLLRLAWRESGTGKGFRPPGETQPLKADGIYGPKTQRFIDHFQSEARTRGAFTAQDGRVDPVVSGGAVGAISHTMYTILALNAARNSRVSKQDDISADPEFPAELRRHFFIDWA